MPKIHSHYENLKIARDAPIEVIRAAYRSLSQKYHPDKNPGNAAAAKIMMLINAAYEVLSDPITRKQHDEWIRQKELESDSSVSANPDAYPDSDRGVEGVRVTSGRRGSWISPTITLVLILVGFFGLRLYWDFEEGRKPNKPLSPRQTEGALQEIPEAATGTTVRKAKDVAVRKFAERLSGNMKQRMVYPYIANVNGWQGTVEVKVEFSRNGHLRNAYVAKSSGHESLDSNAVRLAKEIPIPPIPEVFRGKEFTILIPIVYRLTSDSKSEKKSARMEAAQICGLDRAEIPNTSGYLTSRPPVSTNGRSIVRIDNTKSDSSMVAKLYRLDGGVKKLTNVFFIAKNEKFSVETVGAGTYDLRTCDVASERLFKTETFAVSEKTVERGIRYSEISITLYKVPHGNLQTYPINRDEF